MNINNHFVTIDNKHDLFEIHGDIVQVTGVSNFSTLCLTYSGEITVTESGQQHYVILNGGIIKVRGYVHQIDYYDGIIVVENDGIIQQIIFHPTENKNIRAPHIQFSQAYPSQIKNVWTEAEFEKECKRQAKLNKLAVLENKLTNQTKGKKHGTKR